jgi:cation diffusion facilitator family transporter
MNWPTFTPRQALWLSVTAALLTIALKSGAWWLTGSVGYQSDALESLVNLTGAGFALWMVALAHSPADERHPFGHGKAEYFSAAFEGGLIFVAALAILFAAGERLWHPQAVAGLGGGTVLSVLASLINWGVAQVLFQVARTHRSVALEADGRHLMTDVWTTAGVVAGVAMASLTGWMWLDAVVAAAVALHILQEGWGLLHRAIDGLLDPACTDAEVAQLQAHLQAHLPPPCRLIHLKTRVAGPLRFAQATLQVPGDWSVSQAHTLADVLEHTAHTHTHIGLSTHIEPLPSPSPSSP